MGRIYQIPADSTFLPTRVEAVATFNTPTPGKYNFIVDGNVNIPLIPLTKNYVYLIERLSIGGSISEEKFLNAVENPPTLRIKRIRGNSNGTPIYPKPYEVVKYISDQSLVTFYQSDKKNDALVLTVEGLLNQTADLVGISEIKLNIQIIIHEIKNLEFTRKFKGPLSVNAGRQVMGGV